jgi:hypothetical protein
MGYKSKIKPNEVETLDFKTYTSMLKKEVVKAAKFGQIDVVVLSNYKFACKYTGTLLLLGKFSGELVKFYKSAKLQRKKEKDFARGVCYFETKEDGSVTMHIALQGGVGKPDKIKKNGKGLFKKLGIASNIFKGDPPVVDEKIDLSSQETEEFKTIEETADDENNLKTLKRLAKEYKHAYGNLASQVLPILKGEKPEFTPQHFEIAKAAFKASASFLDKYEEVDKNKRDKFLEFYKRIKNQDEQLKKIAVKVKRGLIKNASHVSSEEMEDVKAMKAVLEEVEETIKGMRQKFQEGFDLIAKVKSDKKL